MELSITEHFMVVCSDCFEELPTRMAGISDGKTGYRKIEIEPCKKCMQKQILNAIQHAIKEVEKNK